MKKYLRTVFALLLSLSLITTLSYASTEDKSQKIDNYSIESLEELKAEIKEKNLGLSKTDEKYLKARTNPKVLEEFLKEKQEVANRILSNTEPLVISSEQEVFEKTYDLGDNCWIKFQFESKQIPTLYERVKDALIPVAYGFSQSGYKTRWDKYGTHTFKATATANYVVATKPGASDCNTYAIYKTTYGYNPVDWDRNHIMEIRTKYLAKDTVDKELKITHEWGIKPYKP